MLKRSVYMLKILSPPSENITVSVRYLFSDIFSFLSVLLTDCFPLTPPLTELGACQGCEI